MDNDKEEFGPAILALCVFVWALLIIGGICALCVVAVKAAMI